MDDDAGRVQHAAERGPPRRASSSPSRAARSPGSTPARISSRARASTVRAASTASGSSLRRARARRRKEGRAAPRSARYASGKRCKWAVATRRSRCFTVRMKRGGRRLARRGRCWPRSAPPSRARCEFRGRGEAGGARARDRRRRESRGPRSTRRSRAWAKRPVTIRAGGHSYHVPRGWLVVDRPSTRPRRARSTPGRRSSLLVPHDVDVAAGGRPRPGRGRCADRDRARGPVARSARPSPLHGTDAVDDAGTGRARSSTELRCSALLSDDVDVVDAPFTAERPAILDPAAAQRRVDARTAARRAGRDRVPRRAARCADAGAARARAADQAADASVRRRVRRRARSRRSFARGSASGSCARTTRSSPSRATRVHVVPSRPGRDVDPTQVVVAVTTAAHGNHIAHIELGARERRADDGEGAGARDPPEARLVHDADGRVVVEPDPQRAPDGRLHRRHGDRARARRSRSTTSSASAPRSAGSSRAR